MFLDSLRELVSVDEQWVPDGDGEFAFTAKGFADQLAKDPSRFPVPPQDVAAIVEAVEAAERPVVLIAHSLAVSALVRAKRW